MSSSRGSAPRRPAVALGILVLAASLSAGCLAFEPPATPRASESSARPVPTGDAPRAPGSLAFAIDEDPVDLLPFSEDLASRRVTELIYDPLYRLDGALRPVPTLAAAPPVVASDALTWRIPLRSGARFHDGSALSAADVTFTLSLAASPECPFARDLCATVAATLVEARVESSTELVLTFASPSAPFLGGALSRIGILPERQSRDAVTRLFSTADAVGADAAALVERIAEATNAEACLGEFPPAGCDVVSYTAELQGLLRRAGVDAPLASSFGGTLGEPDEAAYAGALLERAQALARASAAEGVDRVAAALPLTRLAREPIGSGPFAVEAFQPGTSIELTRHDGRVPAPAAAPGVTVRIIEDPAEAATALRSGAIDWLPEASAEQIAELEQDASLRVVAHPQLEQRAIIFNVRPGRVFADPATRQAFALCIAKEAAVDEAGVGRRVVAWTLTAAGSWAAPATVDRLQGDPRRAGRLLDAAGWVVGADGIRTRQGRRLRSEIHVRPSRSDLVAFLGMASEQLRACGIELVVRDLDLTGDALLDQLRHPNEFETVLVTRTLGRDPDADLAAFESAHITTAENPGDANVGGWSSAELDRLAADARATTDPERRATLYAAAHALLAAELPAYPLWYETAHGAISTRVTTAEGAVDLSSTLAGWDIASWQVKET